MRQTDLHQISEEIKIASFELEGLAEQIKQVVIGQDQMIERLLIGLLSRGHILLEGVPGLAKTLVINTLSESIQGDFSRIQFTPDLLPADVVGTEIYNVKENDFSIKKGPIFANFVLADEINRAPAKVQSALLEAMQERQVTLADNTFKLEEPFLVLATQNPIEQEGTYPLPEAQMDRFMLKCVITYPSLEAEKTIVRDNILGNKRKIQKVFSKEAILRSRELVKKVYMDEKIENYILDLIFATRFPKDYGLSEFSSLIQNGASPRGSINLALASRTLAFLKGRAFVIPEDIREVALDVLRHRIGVTYEAEADGISSEDIVSKIIKTIKVP